jgi:hypothetical protein
MMLGYLPYAIEIMPQDEIVKGNNQINNTKLESG